MQENWLARWREGRTGWHQPQGNSGLRRHWQHVGDRVLVPLCGKSVDLVWLAERGHAVIGVELIEQGIHEFFAEQELEYTIRNGKLPVYEATSLPISIHHGDYFALGAADIGGTCDLLYDRAALVALPPELRPQYAAHTDALLRRDAQRMVLTFEYDQSLVQGPPYSVMPAELLGYWPQLQRVDERDATREVPPKFAEVGVRSVIEAVWRMP